jgi:hypothetical protein
LLTASCSMIDGMTWSSLVRVLTTTSVEHVSRQRPAG